jgi:hypothetical protein
MNKEQYAKYQKAVESFLVNNSVKPGCHGPKGEQAKPFFSRSPCECCGSETGGNRETYSFDTTLDAAPFEADVCVDCAYYLAYERWDDTAIMEAEALKYSRE